MKILAIVLLALLVAPCMAVTNVEKAYLDGFQAGCRLMDLFYQGQAGNQTAEALYLDELARINAITSQKTDSDLSNFGTDHKKAFNFGPYVPPDVVEADAASTVLNNFLR